MAQVSDHLECPAYIHAFVDWMVLALISLHDLDLIPTVLYLQNMLDWVLLIRVIFILNFYANNPLIYVPSIYSRVNS